MVEILLLIALGIFIGFLSGFFGIGGGTILVPIMLLFGYSMSESVGIAIIPMMLGSVFGSLINIKHKMFEVKPAIILGLGGFVGALSSGFVMKLAPEIVLLCILIAIQLFNVIKMLTNMSYTTDKAPIESKGLLFLLGLIVGLICISVGVGGAIIILPTLIVFFRYDIKRAVSTSLFFVIFSSTSGLISLSINGLVNYKIGLLIAVGALFGVYFGTKAARNIDKTLQKKLLVLLSICILFMLFYKFVNLIG